MSEALTKTGSRELSALVQSLKSQRRVDGIPPEDLMEKAADLLEDDGARVFFTTVAGFSRLASLIWQNENAFLPRVRNWLYARFHVEKNAALKEAIDGISQAALVEPNFNITFKRLTAILKQGERTVLAEALLALVAPHGDLPPEHATTVESILSRLLISAPAGAEMIENWQRKRQPPTL